MWLCSQLQQQDNHHVGSGTTETEVNTNTANNKTKPKVTVLNEGAIIIRRQGRADTSDEESSDEEDVLEPELPVVEEPPPRDPLDVEEEELNEKLQTAGFFLSMPEEEQIKKRLLEIKQMRDNPDLFKLENTKVNNTLFKIPVKTVLS